MEEVEFEGTDFEVEEDEEPLEYLLNFSMNDLEGEKACRENRILFITLLHGANRRHYFNVAEDGERGRAVYHPKWINFCKRYNEQQLMNRRRMLPPQ